MAKEKLEWVREEKGEAWISRRTKWTNNRNYIKNYQLLSFYKISEIRVNYHYKHNGNRKEHNQGNK